MKQLGFFDIDFFYIALTKITGHKEIIFRIMMKLKKV